MKNLCTTVHLAKATLIACISISAFNKVALAEPIGFADHSAQIDKQIRYPAESRCFQLGKGQARTSITGDFDGDGKKEISRRS